MGGANVLGDTDPDQFRQREWKHILKRAGIGRYTLPDDAGFLEGNPRSVRGTTTEPPRVLRRLWGAPGTACPYSHCASGVARIGIKKGELFKPDAKAQAVFDKADPDALHYMMEQYHRYLNPWMYEGKLWSTLTPAGDIETDWSYERPSYFDYHARGAPYYAIITSVKNYGTATFYLDLAETPDGKWLDGSKNYKLVVPPNVPVRDFWAVTVYGLETASYVREVSKASVDSSQPDVEKNTDGSIDVYFGPKAPAGKEANWIPTKPGRRFFLLFRFYGPEPGVFDGSFELNDIERVD